MESHSALGEGRKVFYKVNIENDYQLRQEITRQGVVPLWDDFP